MSYDWSQTAFLFPGQGSQAVGMTRDIAEAYPVAAQTFSQADEILGYSLSQLCFEGPAEALNDTLNTQPALFVAGVATWRALQDSLPEPAQPRFVAGHSLGEFTALVAAGALSFEDGLGLVKRRAELMQEAGETAPGAVAAILALDIDTVNEICAAASESDASVVVVANDNCPGQVVISGENAALDRAVALAEERGAKKVVKLPVSVAVHSPLMQPAAEAFAAAIDAVSFQPAEVPVVANVTAQAITTPEAIIAELKQQITASVKWTGSVQTMLDCGVSRFIEFGPGGVLIGLVKRIDRKTERLSLETPDALAELVG